MRRNHRLDSVGITGWNASESPAGLRRNTQALYPGADVRRAGGQGHDQGGIDVTAVLPDGRRLDFQCKRMNRFGPDDVREAVQAYAGKADERILVLSRVASPQTAEAICREPGWLLWDNDDLSRKFRQKLSTDQQDRLVDIYFRGQRRALLGRDEPGVWLTAETFFRPFSSREKALNHEWRLVGRDRELPELLSAAAGTHCPVCMLVAPGGMGKSRLLKEFAFRVAQAEPGTTLRFLDRDSELKPSDLEALGGGPKLIVVDDAHDRDRLGLLFGFVTLPENQARLVVATRPYAQARIRQEAALSSITDIPIVVLEPLAKAILIELAAEVLVHFHGPEKWAADIVASAGDSPLSTALIARAVARDEKPLELARSSTEVRDLTSGKFASVLLGELGQGRDAALNRDILDVLALVQPFHPEDAGLLDLIKTVKDVKPDAAGRALRDMMEGGVVFRRGSRHRLMPDLLSDSIVERSCIDASGVLSSFAVGALAAMPAGLLPNALLNLGRLDWRTTGADPADSRLLSGVWQSYAAIKSEGDPRLEAAKVVAVYQPRQALDLAGDLVRRGRRLPSLSD